jgi:hypothetical protein
VHGDDVGARDGEQAEGVGVPQVALAGHRQARQVGQGEPAAAGHAGVAEPLPEQPAGHGQQAVDQAAEPGFLEGGQLGGGQRLAAGVENCR